jgi:hypothetical protein
LDGHHSCLNAFFTATTTPIQSWISLVSTESEPVEEGEEHYDLLEEEKIVTINNKIE